MPGVKARRIPARAPGGPPAPVRLAADEVGRGAGVGAEPPGW